MRLCSALAAGYWLLASAALLFLAGWVIQGVSNTALQLAGCRVGRPVVVGFLMVAAGRRAVFLVVLAT